MLPNMYHQVVSYCVVAENQMVTEEVVVVEELAKRRPIAAVVTFLAMVLSFFVLLSWLLGFRRPESERVRKQSGPCSS